MPLDAERLQAVFQAAVELSDAVERAGLLRRECGDDADLRQQVERLLAAHDDSGDLPSAPLEHTGPIIPADAPEPPREAVGSVLAGKYKLLQAIGEGGMGAVYMADQLHPVKRRVAVKLIRAGMDSKQVLARFEAERQALALMDHPHIAKVLDAGTTEGNQPFFVMELVKGVPATEYCDQHRLSIPDRLTLFMQVCSAVQHAHQKGIIHRDLKPSNILVESHDGKPVPKVIDFGLAKAMSGHPLTDHTLFTAIGQVAGTPLYMAPEQAAFNAIDVDTRADVYALGVLLYELLTGTTPLEREQLKKKAFDEILRIIRESDPPTPSKRLSSPEAKPEVAAVRGMEPVKLGRFVKGELDWIVMKALSKERDQRYETANGFARDVERFLNHEPVVAGPPSAAYRLRKFARRNRPQVVGGGLVLLALVLGLVGTTVGFVRADQRRKEAEEERRKAEEAEAATLEAYKESTDDAIEQLIGSKPELGPQERAYIEKTLKRWQEFANRQGDDARSQDVRAHGHFRVGYLWQKLDRRDEARREFEAARELGQELAAAFPTVPVYRQGLALTRNNLGLALALQDQRDEARREFEAARKLGQELAAAFPTVPVYRQNLALTYNNLGLLLAGLGKPEEARREYEAARELQQKLADAFPAAPAHREGLAVTHNNLGLLLQGLGKPEEARREHEAARDLQQKLAAAFPAVPRYQVELGGSYCNFGVLVRDEGKPADSLHWYGLAIRTLTPVYQNAPRTVMARQSLAYSHLGRAMAYDRLGKHAEAIKDWDRAVELSPGAEQPSFRASRANSRVQAGQVAEAVAEVADLTKESPAGTPGAAKWNSGQWYDFACVYAVASTKLADKKQEYADRAMELLQKAVKAGYKDAAHMAKDNDLDPLRGRDDFKKLLESLANAK